MPVNMAPSPTKSSQHGNARRIDPDRSNAPPCDLKVPMVSAVAHTVDAIGIAIARTTGRTQPRVS